MSKTININSGETGHDISHNFWCCDQDLDTQCEKVAVEK